ncbi:protein-L-isoaspartate O-methyltransferase [Streptomyces agglomeratus]|uniref:Protein-L-isoaspartate O-methyltransferase n=2 Tax=Streptomyces agglomeratus TaxID=285458 RepID=A0A1E5PK34_9ACTN|nr:protein-L-isoaspartate O-methyltransferase [Streptomyces agglomeratus]OEJ42061.1 protein-L-isoaspartate O-methyltransferase [Streptomyces agglomeratus]OEJ49424.1 protein-L-isoaspartate O-methyltransferase [Streptomyces agglomeratus]OEJ55369.1 protein-L-isoaspartate O-methyltransferase [Streptomyces agglomeratus]OEJ62743.1 protein-L-isoaspartate O-methyltransferase [Streptomyces agglomeratus]
MEQRGAWPARAPWIRQAAGDLPREAFATDQVWYWDGHAYVPVDRSANPDRWAALVYPDPDDATITQITHGVPSSSLSCEAVVADMLDSLLLEEGHQVLELGAGTGRNAALAARRTGPGRVITVEVDKALAQSAQGNVEAAGADVSVVVGDGAAGWPSGAPYDRVISTFAVDEVPWTWVAQTRSGGRIVTPWGRLGHVALKVAADGRSASGWMQGLAAFMPPRHLLVGRSFAQVRGDGPSQDEGPFEKDVCLLADNVHLRFALRVALPEVEITTAVDEDGMNAWLHDGVSSWATLSALGGGRTIADQGGPRRLADELEHAWDRWLAEDRPDVYDFGMTVEPNRQYVWSRDPGNSWWQVKSAGRAPLVS